MTENVIIIGGGPAGLSAAIYLARADLNPLVFAGSPPGGQLILTSEVENYPGFESILGPDLIEKMRDQAKKFGTRIIDENVLKVDFAKKPFEIMGSVTNFLSSSGNPPPPGESQVAKNSSPSPIMSKSVIIATGAKALWLDLPSETRLRGKGVSACATCDGFFFREKTVAVIGGGDTALEEALTLTKFAKKIYIIHRRDFFRASKIMQERVLKNEKIEVIWNSEVEEILGKDRVEGIKLKKVGMETGQENGSKKIEKNPSSTNQLHNSLPNQSSIFQLQLNGVFVAIGHKPDTELFKDKIDLDEKGYIKILERRETSVPGVFAAGDCVDHIYRQAVTAAGTGVEAALDVERYLDEN